MRYLQRALLIHQMILLNYKMLDIFNLNNKTILVTGASSGIGRSVAIEVSKAGAKLIILGQDESRLKETLSYLSGDQHLYLMGDLTIDENIISIISQISELDGIVFSAGVNDKSLVKSINREKINKMFNINIFSPMLFTKELIKQKKINKEASIVMISSISSHYATISNALYASSKGALESFIKVLALELSPRKIRVNGIRPGMVETQLLKSYSLQEELETFKAQFPLGRFGNPEEIAYGVVYLLSDATKWMTGSIFNIDGGITLR